MSAYRFPPEVFHSRLLVQHHEVPPDSVEDGLSFAIFHAQFPRHTLWMKWREAWGKDKI